MLAQTIHHTPTNTAPTNTPRTQLDAIMAGDTAISAVTTNMQVSDGVEEEVASLLPVEAYRSLTSVSRPLLIKMNAE